MIDLYLKAGSKSAMTTALKAAGFIADTASLPLVVSNLVNIVSADFFKIGFNRYAAVMIPVNLVSVAATLAVLMWFWKWREARILSVWLGNVLVPMLL